MKRVLAAMLVLVAAGAANAADYNWAVNNTAIPDNNPTGVSIDLVVNDNIPLSSESTNCVEVTLSFQNIAGGTLGHTWAGDLVATLSKVGDGSVTLFNRIGKTSATSGFGNSANFVGPYKFTNKTTNSIWQFASGTPTPIPSGSYQASAALTGARIDMCAPFLQSGSVGTWRLTVSDNAGGDTGVITAATLTLKPEPSTLALLGLGVVALIRRRK
ncbi:MAG: PEP-CTERM sorting domain-containing protein [Planctomycetes bacterium]|nr:PEP-CTERM sorting domain-containing protein [Planctomycetota bacterium]